MTIGNQQSATTLGGNGSNIQFVYNFVAGVAQNLVVQYTDTTGLTITLPPSQYSVIINATVPGQLWGVGGTVTYPINGGPAIANGTSITITRLLPIEQLFSISNQGSLSLSVIEQALDTLCMELQQVASRTGQWRGVWLTNTQYNYADMVQDGVNGLNTNNYYMCINPNISGVWTTDLAAGDWELFFNTQQVAGYAMAAAASAAAAAASAVTSTTEAGVSTTAAGNALTYSATASAAATTATTQAGIATMGATTATTQAGIATTGATTATTQAGFATTGGTTATTQAGISTTQAAISTAEAAIATAAALSAASTLTATSTTSNTIGTGSFTFTTQANKNFFPGQFIIVASNANGANYIHGQVTSYSGTTLIITESDNGGSGTHTDWNISASGPQGASGSGAGTVTSASVASANGFAGTVANPTTTPAITVSTTVNGLLKGNGTAVAAASAGTDYVAPGGALGTPSSGVGTNLTGTATALNIGGNAATATSATTATTAGTCSGNSATATKLATPRTIAITGDLTYNSGSFDGSANVTAAGTLATVNSDVGSYTNASFTVNGKGLITAASSGTSGGIQNPSYIIRQLSSANPSYTPGAYVKSFYAFVMGSTGSYITNGGSNNGGVGGAGYSEKFYSSPSGSYAYTIGAGHTGASTGTGASTTFDVITVTGSAGSSTTTGGAGGIGSGGGFNATGGAGGNGSGIAYGGPGGGAGRAGNGGTGGNSPGSNGGGGGGTGGNAASGLTGGAAATVPSGSALSLPYVLHETYPNGAGTNGSPGNPGIAGDDTSSFDLSYYLTTVGASGGQHTGSTAGTNGSIVILELLA